MRLAYDDMARVYASVPTRRWRTRPGGSERWPAVRDTSAVTTTSGMSLSPTAKGLTLVHISAQPEPCLVPEASWRSLLSLT